ncbi:hypothetical protein GCM10023203_56770 [Actinomycetospora straminea]|uniref:DUF5709 domain-containing protein n=2 Tax=Actinomycetospora straminea TaxID=663607 RepID=A0ABP9F8L7_9PSEU
MSQPEQQPDRPQAALRWPAERHTAYLDSRPDGTSPYNPAAEYGDRDWREPASEAEAAARTAYLREHFPPAPGWTPRPLTPVENALQDAQERAVLSERAHDSDPDAWADYYRLQAVDRLAPLPTHDTLDDLPVDEHGQPDPLASAEWRDEEQVALAHRADETAFDGRPGDTADAPAGPERLRQRLENLRAARAAEAVESVPDEDEERREHLLRWHDDDHRAIDVGADLDSSHETGDSGSGSSGPGWGR